MKLKLRNNGSVLIMIVFLTAMLATLVMGILQMNTEELVLIRHRTFAAQAQALAEAGLNKAMAEIRNDPDWRMELEVELDVLDDGDWGSVLGAATTLGSGFYDTGFDAPLCRRIDDETFQTDTLWVFE